MDERDHAIKNKLMELFDAYYLELDAKHVKGQEYLQIVAAVMVKAHCYLSDD